ncbi:MAG TPA: amidase family protein [Candidatus Dormibacteraeota bacterium]|nr:amidase family protein [Candidatus Dormibacteraeota bacterium]
MPQYIYQSACELAKLIREGRAGSVDIVKEHVTRIRQRNAELNAVVDLFEEEAMETAAERDRQARDGKFLGPLHGVPVTIKEQFWIKGKRSTINSKMHKDFVAPVDAVVVDRIRKSGAVILGHTNIPRFLLDYQVWGDIYPEGKNPYNTDCTPGGSTGGGAAAVAAGFSPLELGGDLGGSIRVPSNFCGLYGLKPTEKTVPLHGNVPLRKNAKTYIVHLAQAGPLARTLEDVELLWKIIVGPHESDRDIPRIEWRVPAKKSLHDYRIAWVDGWPGHPVSAQVSSAIQGLAAKLEQHGCRVENRMPEGNLHEESLNLWMGIFPYIIAQGLPWIARRFLKMDLNSTLLKGVEKYRTEFDKAFAMSANHYGEMMLRRHLAVARWERFFADYDFLICPGSFGPAYARTMIGSKLRYDGAEMIYGDYAWPFVACFNASGHPALNIPLGLGKEGLPLGAQIVGPYWSEPELLNFAPQASPLTGGFVKPANY